MAKQLFADHCWNDKSKSQSACAQAVGPCSGGFHLCTRAKNHAGECEYAYEGRVFRKGFDAAKLIDTATPSAPQFGLEKWKAGTCGYCGAQRGDAWAVCMGCFNGKADYQAGWQIIKNAYPKNEIESFQIAAQNRTGATIGEVKRKAELIVKVDGIPRVKSVLDAADSFYRYVCTLGPLVVKEMPSEERRFRDEIAKMGQALRPEAFKREGK